MRLIFVRADNIGGALIRMFEGGEASHVGIDVGDCIIDSTLLHGTTCRSHVEFIRRRTLIDTIDVPLPDEAAAITFLREQVGRPYDWTAIIGFMLFRDWSYDDRWYCSELAATAMLRGGLTIADRGRRFGVRICSEVAHARAREE